MALINKLKAIGDAIRAKTGKTDELTLDQMVTEIEGIEGGNSGGGGSGGMLVCNVEVPSNYTRIAEVEALEISFPNATSIVTEAFRNNANLKAISLPNVTTIGHNAFNVCSNLVEVYAPNVTTIDNAAFAHSSNLVEVYAPNAATIGNVAFTDTRISIAEFPNVTTIGESAFAGCMSLKTVRMPKLEVVTEYAFHSCINLEEIDIPNATTIEASAFGCGDGYYNESLTSVDLPNVTSIGGLAFRNCRKLTAIIFRTTSTVCVCEFAAFEDTPMMTGEGHIYVPAVMYEYYRAGYEAALDQLMPGFFDILFRKIEDYPEICG